MEQESIFRGRRVLITGASGLIGSSLAERLLAFGGVRLVAAGRSRPRL